MPLYSHLLPNRIAYSINNKLTNAKIVWVVDINDCNAQFDKNSIIFMATLSQWSQMHLKTWFYYNT